MKILTAISATAFILTTFSHELYAQSWRLDRAVVAKEAADQTSAATAQTHAYLNKIGYAQLAKRAETVAAIKTKKEADARKSYVRDKIINLMGGLPQATGPVRVKTFDTITDSEFHIENIAYESFPGYWVTANVYVPNGKGPFPAMVIAPGHGGGKTSQYSWGANFASAGFLVLSIDPMGQGERLQHFDPELGTSKVERSGEHEHANQTTLLIGHHIARYWMADGIRGVDYLTQRKDVKANRIGTFGCSGGGTAAAYLAAIDPRIRVAAVSSFTTSFKELLPGNGPQDAEQTLPKFIASGLDFADWVEQVAPRPYAIVAFEDDFFPFAGAKWTYEEAKRFYSHYDAQAQIEFIAGAGGHCNLQPVTPKLLSFLYKHLKEPGAEIPEFPRRSLQNTDILAVTPTGQLSTSIGSNTVEGMAQKDGQAVVKKPVVLTSSNDLQKLQKRLRHDIQLLTATNATLKEIPKVVVESETQADNYRLETITLASEPGISLNAVVGLPNQKGPRPVVVLMDARPIHRTVASNDFTSLVKAGNIVVAFQPRDVLGDPPPNPNQLALGPYMPELLRAIVVGKTIVGMRVDDTIRLLNWLLSRKDVDKSSITLYGKAGLGMVALHTAALDARITKVVTEKTLLSYRTALQAGLHRNLSEIVIPNVLRHYDTVDLLQSISPRPVVMVNPASAMGVTVRDSIVKTELAAVFESDRNLGTPNRIQIRRRNFFDPLLLE